MTTLTYDYQPTSRQQLAHSLYADETLYGGAAGGGKSRFARATAVAFAFQVPGSATFIFRRTFPDLNRAGGMIPMLQQELAPLVNAGVASYNASEHKWKFRNGSVIELGYLARDSDVGRYQGSEAQLMIFDEATQLTEYQYTYLLSRLRSSGRVKQRMAELNLRPRAILTANPGGIGHAWVKSRFIDPADPETVWRPAPNDIDPDPGTRVFIPAKVSDNKHIDEHYEKQLRRLPEDQRRALLDGDWDVYSGQMFKSFRRSVHVIDPEEFGLQDVIDAPKAVGVDYGMSAPFCALWGALLPNGIVYVYREAYRAELTPEQQADLILSLEVEHERRREWPIQVVLDSACWARSPGQLVKQPQVIADGARDLPPEGSIAWSYWERFGSDLQKSVKDRLSSAALVHDRLEVRRDGFPRLLISSQCRNLIRTLPALPRSDRNPEDVDTNAEDHCLAGETLVDTLEGPRRIDSLVGTTGWVRGLTGKPVRYLKVWRSKQAAPVVRVRLEDGRSLRLTADHKVMTDGGWVEAGALTPDRMVLSAMLNLWDRNASATNVNATQGRTTTSAATTSSGKENDSTDASTLTTTDRFPVGGTSTTKTTTEATTTPTTLSRFRRLLMVSITASTSRKLNERRAARTRLQHRPATRASRVSSALKPLAVAGATWLGQRSSVWSAGLALSRRSRVALATAAGLAHSVRIVSVEPDGTADVYDMSVDHVDHAFTVADGLVVSNCYDALSYLLQHFAHRYGEAITTAERQRRGRGEGLKAFGGVPSLTGGVAGAPFRPEW